MTFDYRFILICGIAGTLLYSLSLSMPLLGGIISFFTPLPLGYIFLKKDGFNFYLCFLITVMLIFFIGGKLGVFLYLIQYGVPFFLFFELYGRGINTVKAVAIAISAVVAVTVLFLLMQNSFNINLAIKTVNDFLNMNFQLVLKSYKSLGLSDKELATISGNLKTFSFTITRIMPSLMIMFYGSIFLLNLPVIEKLTKRRFGNYHLKDFRAPFWLVWFFIVSGFGIFFFKKNSVWWLFLNIFITSSFIYLIQGFGVVENWFNRLKYSKLMKNFFYILILFSQFLLITIAIIGLFDNWFDFRKIIQSGGTDESNT